MSEIVGMIDLLKNVGKQYDQDLSLDVQPGADRDEPQRQCQHADQQGGEYVHSRQKPAIHHGVKGR